MDCAVAVALSCRDSLKNATIWMPGVPPSDEPLKVIAQQEARGQRLLTIPGIGAKGATALVAAVGEEPRRFKNGRGVAAWLGWVPRQHTPGGRERRLGISPRGDRSLRPWLIPGARVVLR